MKRILSFIGMMAVGAVSVLAADSMIRGYTFDGATGLKTGAMLEDLVTQATLTQAAGLTNNASRILDGDTLWATNGVFGTTLTNYVATVKTNSITGGHIKDSTIQSVDILDGTLTGDDIQPGSICTDQLGSDCFAVPSTNNTKAFFAYLSGNQVFSSVAGHYKVTLDSELWDFGDVFNTSGNCFVAPFAGMWHFDAAISENSIGPGKWFTAMFYKNGLQISGGSQVASGTNFLTGLTSPMNSVTSIDLYLTNGAAVQLYVNKGFDQNITANGTASYTTFMSGHLIAK